MGVGRPGKGGPSRPVSRGKRPLNHGIDPGGGVAWDVHLHVGARRLTMNRRWILPLSLLVIPACAASDDDEGNASAEVNAAANISETTDKALKDQGCGNGDGRGCYTNYAITA